MSKKGNKTMQAKQIKTSIVIQNVMKKSHSNDNTKHHIP